MSAALKMPAPDQYLVPSNEQEMARCLADPEWRLFSGQLYRIMIKGNEEGTETSAPFIPNRAQRRFMRRLWYRNVVLKARQLGYSTLICIVWLDHALFNPEQRCGIVADTRENAETLFRDKICYAYLNLPEPLRKAMPLARESASELLFAHNNSSVRVGTSMRSGTLHRLHVSEFGKICAKYPEKAQEIITGSLPAVPPNGVTVIESTAEGREGEFYNICEKAQALHDTRAKLTNKQWRLHFSAWWQAPEYRLEAGGVIITAQDHEYFDAIEVEMQTKIDEEQRAWYVATRDGDFSGDDEKMWQEYPSTPQEPFKVSTQGTYYAKQLTQARKEGRIGVVPIDRRVPVNTFWDLGLSDAMAIWLHQRVGLQDRFVGYIEGAGEPLGYYVRQLENWRSEAETIWGKHFLPHDGAHRRPGIAGLQTYADMLAELGLSDIEIVARIDDVTRGIQMVRDRFTSVWISEAGCTTGINRLAGYRKDWNKRLGVWSSRPRHDDNSNGADAFRGWAQTPETDFGGTYQQVKRSSGSWRTA